MNPYQDIVDAYFQVHQTRHYQLASAMNLESLSVAQAYQIQHQIIEARVNEGERIVGYKVGCTSRAIQQQFGLRDPIKGFVTQPFVYKDQVNLDARSYVNLSVEPEFVIRIGRDVTEEFLDQYEIQDAVESVAAGIELHHYQFCFEPTFQELIILNGIHAGLVVGREKQLDKGLDLSLEGVGVFVN
jgi:2-keto-4-pentenoate hydratase